MDSGTANVLIVLIMFGGVITYEWIKSHERGGGDGK